MIVPFTGEVRFAPGSPNATFAMVQAPPQATEPLKSAVRGLPTVTVAAFAAVAKRQEAAATAISEAMTRLWVLPASTSGRTLFARTSWRNRKNYDWLKNPP